ncbi:MAG: HYExAFE family protein [Planctomycetia bacterium]
MVDFGTRYEQALKYFLRSRRILYIPIDQSQRVYPPAEPPEGLIPPPTLKNLDFIIQTNQNRQLLIDVKGRKMLARKRTKSLQNWVTEDDVASLLYWERALDSPALALLVFVYLLPSPADQVDFEDSFSYLDRHYGCLAVPAALYQEAMRVRSPRWKTVFLRSEAFRRLAVPLSSYF